MDVTPVVNLGRDTPRRQRSASASTVTALVFREGHDQLGAEVVLTDPSGTRRPPVRMHDVRGRCSRNGRHRSPPTPRGRGPSRCRPGDDPIGTWLHDAPLKIRAGVDVELMFTEGVLLLERVAHRSTSSTQRDEAAS